MATINKLKIAEFFHSIDNKRVQCDLCPHNCIIDEGRIGLCKTRQNSDNTLYSLNYGMPVAINIDPVEKKPLYHFLPGSKTFSFGCAGCNLRCSFCQNFSISQVSPEKIKCHNMTPADIVNSALDNGCKSISYTYSEPTVFYEMVKDTARLAKTKGLRNILVSNGFINVQAISLLAEFIDAANIDIKAYSEEFYKKYTGGSLAPVLDTLKVLNHYNVHIEITTLIIPGLNDSANELTKLAKWIIKNLGTDTPLHFSRFFPQYKMTNIPVTPMATLVQSRESAMKNGLRYVYTGNIDNSEGESTYCHNCNKKIIERNRFQIILNKAAFGKCYNCSSEIRGIWQP